MQLEQPITSDDLQRLIRNDNSMVRWICSRKLSDRCSMFDLHGQSCQTTKLRQDCLRWYSHLMRMEAIKWQSKILSYDLEGVHHEGDQRYVGWTMSARPRKILVFALGLQLIVLLGVEQSQLDFMCSLTPVTGKMDFKSIMMISWISRIVGTL